MASYTGVSGKKYILGQQLGVGGEGAVYELSGNSACVAKVYKTTRFKSESEKETMERKLKAMLAMNISATVDGLLRLAWPQDILYENNKIVGFVMPRVNTKYKIFDVYRTGKNSLRDLEYNNYTWKYSVQFAYNMAWVVNYLHQHNIVIGDLNQNNIAVDTKTGAVILIDCDSFDIRDPRTGEHFPCEVGLEEMLAPELQTVGKLTNGTFTKESDNFSLAIHIFLLLMNNEDPFGGKITTNASSSAVSGNAAIINGECSFVRNVPGKTLLPRMPKLDILPPEIQQLFQRTFNYTATTALSKKNNRATAEEWKNALYVLATPEPNPNLKTCSSPKHVYPSHNASCPWCAIEKAIPAPVPPVPIRTSTTTSQVSVSTSNASTVTKPVRREPYLFYAVLIIFGIASGFVFGDWVRGLVNKVFDINMSATLATILLVVFGIASGIGLAFKFEDDYIHADNGIPWLFLGFASLLLPLVISLILGIVAAIIIAIVSIVLGILAIIFCGACCYSMFEGS